MARDAPGSVARERRERVQMKVLHVESGRHLYGGARQALYLLEGLQAHGVDSVLACASGSEVAQAAHTQGAQVRELRMGGDLDPLLWWRLLRLIRAERPDLVHLHSRRGADTQGALAARLTGVRTVLSRRVDHAPAPFLLSARYRLYDRVIAISEEIAFVLRSAGVPADKLVCVPSAVDARRFTQPLTHAALCAALGVPVDSVVIGVVAQLIERKGHIYLVQALPSILAAVPQARVVYFGRGPLAASLRAEAERIGVAEHVVEAGFRADLEQLLGALDAVVHPATAEGLGVALLEAAAAGRPIVASDAGGIPEVVRDGITGLLVPPRDPAALAGAVVRVLKDPALAQRLGAAARAHVAAHYSVAAMTAGNLAVYRALGAPAVAPARLQ
jgi:glycosyltransferase involved in cell wall biosynthesis